MGGRSAKNAQKMGRASAASNRGQGVVEVRRTPYVFPGAPLSVLRKSSAAAATNATNANKTSAKVDKTNNRPPEPAAKAKAAALPAASSLHKPQRQSTATTKATAKATAKARAKAKALRRKRLLSLGLLLSAVPNPKSAMKTMASSSAVAQLQPQQQLQPWQRWGAIPDPNFEKQQTLRFLATGGSLPRDPSRTALVLRNTGSNNNNNIPSIVLPDKTPPKSTTTQKKNTTQKKKKRGYFAKRFDFGAMGARIAGAASATKSAGAAMAREAGARIAGAASAKVVGTAGGMAAIGGLAALLGRKRKRTPTPSPVPKPAPKPEQTPVQKKPKVLKLKVTTDRATQAETSRIMSVRANSAVHNSSKRRYYE